MRTFSLFLASMGFSLSRFFPVRRQQLIKLLEEFSEDLPDFLCCEDILEIWLEEYGPWGLVLGNIGLFALGFLLMLAVDFLLHRLQQPLITTAMQWVQALFCFTKFYTPNPKYLFLILGFCAIWLINSFQWTLAFVFLVLFANTLLFERRRE